MAKPLSDILKGVKASKTEPGSTGTDPGVDYAPKAKAERDWVAKHKTEKHEDRVGNTDAPYKASTKYVLDDEKENKHGNKQKEAEAVYEAAKKNVEKPTEVHAFKAQVSKDRGPTKIVRLHVKMKTPNEGHEIAAKHLEKQGYDVHQTMLVGKVSPLFAKPVNEESFEEAMDKQQLIDYHKGRHERIVKDLMNNPKAKGLTHAASVEHQARTALKKLGVDVQKPKHPSVFESACNMTNEGTYCPVHENASCKESLVNPLLGSKDNGDDESAEMAKTQLRALANKAMALAMYLSDDMVVEPWVQAKIAVAKDQVTAVHDYMVYGDKKEQTAPNDTPITFPGMNVDAEVGARL